ncbi:hypothetical protein PIB30_028976 [Stylosanthes scabra]|uniref:Ubiquitin-like protease family profile domain-containing protein n=1 Tax=Stylosanthes scabra TaxID=79078 RepID=A0ABU6VDC3_9FABA|nr:hypothetical protein [Stylosanthes scabra]
MAEVIAMGFRDLEDMPNWTVKQELFLHLGSKFDLENNLIRDDVSMIDVNASVIERAIGLPSYGYDFPDYAPANNRFAALKLRWGQMLQIQEDTIGHCKSLLGLKIPSGTSKERVILFQRLECGPLNRYRGAEPCEFENQNEADYDQEERVQNDSPMTSSQVEREVEADWPTMDVDEEFLDLLGKVEKEARKRYASQHPDGLTSKDAEVLDIPPIREILPENIVLNAEEDPCTIRLKPLTSEEEKKIYNSVMYGSKGNNLQEEKIAMWRGDANFFLIRGEFRFLRSKGWIDDKWLLPVCNRLHWYLYAFNLDKKELLVLDSMHDHAFDDLRSSLDTYVPNNDDCGIYVIKFMEDWKPDSILNEYTNQELAKIRRRLVLKIALSNFNTNRGTFLKEAYAIPQR